MSVLKPKILSQYKYSYYICSTDLIDDQYSYKQICSRMRRLLLLALLFGQIVQLFGQANFESKDRARIAKNKVKKQVQWSYDYVNEKPSAKGYMSASTTFDKNGNIIEVINYKADGKVTSVLTYTYDSHNNKTSYSRFKGNKETLTYKQTIIYDAKGNKISETGFDGVSNFANSFTYDTNNKLIEIKYTTDNSITEKRIFKNNGNNIEMTVIGPTNTILSKEISTYDGKKNILEEVKYVQDNVTQKYNYAYDPAGKKVEETKQHFGNLAYIRKYTYDVTGNILKITEERPAIKVYTAFEYKYNPSGSVAEEKWVKENSTDYSRKTHKYDAKGLESESDCYFASYKFSVLYKFTYEVF